MNQVRISDSLWDLTGEGLEYLIKGDQVLARFWNGNFLSLSKDIPIEDVTVPIVSE